MISGGSAAGGSTVRERKRYARQVAEDLSAKKKTQNDGVISFDESDLEGVSRPYNDALVVTLNMDGSEVKRVMIDTGSLVDLLYYDTFKQMEIPEERLLPIEGPIKGVTGESAYLFARVFLKVKFGQKPRQIEKNVEFLVVKFVRAYNAIIGRATQNSPRAIVSTYYQTMKFLTPHGVGLVRGQQRIARKCYMAETRALDGAVVLTSSLDVRVDEETERMNPAKERQQIILDEEDQSKFTNLGTELEKGLAKEIADCLIENRSVPNDMPGISRAVASHSLGFVKTGRDDSKERKEVIEKEIEKLLDAGFIREVKYPEWLANVVLVKKKNGKWRMCIDFTDLNKACPKNSFPLPKIDQLVDATSGHELLSFLNAFSGYHQIQMSLEDEEKTAFITDQGIYCYQIGRTVEAYVDDMVVKNKTATKHVEDFKEAFLTLNKFQMKLNPEKCVFGVASGKFLGFMITQRGIESPAEGEKLIIYLAVTDGAISAVLVRSDRNEQFPIYYVSKVLTGPEARYASIEKLALSLITTTRKLKPYFQSHTIEVWIDQPLRQCLQKPETSGRLVKWAVELGEFDIHYRPRTTIKAQVLVDFVAEMSQSTSQNEQRPAWSLFVDGSSNVKGCGVGVVLIGPHQEQKMEYAFRLEFRASNNEAKYEALIAGLQLAREIEVKYLKVYSDSQIVVGQVTGQYEAKGDNMIKYLELVKRELSNFEEYSVSRIDRKQNVQADALSKMASDQSARNNILVEQINQPSIQKASEVLETDVEQSSWMEPIKQYLLKGTQPLEALGAKKLRVKTAEYVIVNDILYKRSYD
ncbi:hypothetical protein K2173_022700 [Erythroxylum novogranatense]|uniref:RNase H type-1 domain-containing protein n=1 Tax=Erythroxylum novogranatense TaxID=1862640 RepID=A0AAV8TP56_9ROSI|nr:hypothetical protein K2173_022700 [Erythroxylum novogranatense]